MARLTEIVFDSLHPAALARFWAAAIEGYAVRAYDEAETARLAALGFTPETDPSVAVDGPGPTLFFQRTDAVTTARSRVHLDLAVPDRRAEVVRLLALGATVKREADSYTVLCDPEGNAFCVFERESS
jgi:hypothetical protein